MNFWQKLKLSLFAKPQPKKPSTTFVTPSLASKFVKPKPVTPPWVTELLKVNGLHEVRDRMVLSKWLKSDGATLGDPSKLPWCGDAVDTAITLALPKEERTGDLKKNPYWALNWLYFGEKSDAVYGAILVFKRPSGGHVGFAVGQNETHYEVLGGNQGNTVSKVFIEKSRCVGIRWPKSYTKEKTPLPYRKLGTVSTNEA